MFKLNIECNFVNHDLEERYYLDFFKEFTLNLYHEFKHVGLVIGNNQIKIGVNTEGTKILNLECECQNMGFLANANTLPTAKHSESLVDLITENFAVNGLTPEVKVAFSLSINQNPEFVTDYNGKEMDEHFHLYIPNQSGYAQTSIHGIGTPLEHYHIVSDGQVGPALYADEPHPNLKHKHNICGFSEGYYTTTNAIVSDLEHIPDHFHNNVYLNKYGNGEINELDHTHRIVNGVIEPAKDGHTHYLIRE